MLNIIQTNEILKNGGFSDRQMRQCFENYNFYDNCKQQKSVFEICRNYVLYSWLLLLGVPGTGKDHLLSSIIRFLVRHEKIKTVYSASLTSFFREFRSRAYQTNHGNEHIAFDWFCGHDLICFRDIATRNLSEFEKSLLIDIFDYFYEHRKPIFASGNLSPDKFSEYLDVRVLDRFREMDFLTENGFLAAEWESYRKPNIKKKSKLDNLLTLLPMEMYFQIYGKNYLYKCKFCEQLFDQNDICGCNEYANVLKKTELFGEAKCASNIRLLEEKNSNILKKTEFPIKTKMVFGMKLIDKEESNERQPSEINNIFVKTLEKICKNLDISDATDFKKIDEYSQIICKKMFENGIKINDNDMTDFFLNIINSKNTKIELPKNLSMSKYNAKIIEIANAESNYCQLISKL